MVGKDHCFISGFMAYESSASHVDTVPPFKDCLLPEYAFFMNREKGTFGNLRCNTRIRPLDAMLLYYSMSLCSVAY